MTFVFLLILTLAMGGIHSLVFSVYVCRIYKYCSRVHFYCNLVVVVYIIYDNCWMIHKIYDVSISIDMILYAGGGNLVCLFIGDQWEGVILRIIQFVNDRCFVGESFNKNNFRIHRAWQLNTGTNLAQHWWLGSRFLWMIQWINFAMCRIASVRYFENKFEIYTY